jgi:hypothetical protein
VFFEPVERTVLSAEISADITLKGEGYDDRVPAVCWYGRDAPAVPLRHNDTQTLFIVLCDEKTLTTYEHQYKKMPLERVIQPAIVFAKIHLYVVYEDNRILNLYWCVGINRTSEGLTAEFIEESVFEEAAMLSSQQE